MDVAKYVLLDKGEQKKQGSLNLWNALNHKCFDLGSWNIHIMFISQNVDNLPVFFLEPFPNGVIAFDLGKEKLEIQVCPV